MKHFLNENYENLEVLKVQTTKYQDKDIYFIAFGGICVNAAYYDTKEEAEQDLEQLNNQTNWMVVCAIASYLANKNNNLKK